MSDAQADVKVQAMSLACPPGWQDRSMLVLAGDRPGSSGVSPTLVVTREPVTENLLAQPGGALEAFVDRQLDAMRRDLSEFVEVARGPAEVSSSATELKIDWESSGVPLRQWILYACPNGSEVVIATATAGRRDFNDMQETFRAMLASLHLG